MTIPDSPAPFSRDGRDFHVRFERDKLRQIATKGRKRSKNLRVAILLISGIITNRSGTSPLTAQLRVRQDLSSAPAGQTY